MRVDPGTREMVTYLAKRCATPSKAKASKHGWWGAEGYIWAYYDTALFTKKAVPEAEGYAGSKEMHQPARRPLRGQGDGRTRGPATGAVGRRVRRE